MKHLRIICILIVLCLLLACVPTEGPTETSSEPEETASTPSPVPTPKDAKEAALLYAGERVNLYLARTEDSWGVAVEELTWEKQTCFYQPLAGTKGTDGLTVTEIEPQADESFTEALFYIRYLDADGQLRVFCLDHPDAEFPYFYPISDEAGITLTEDSRRTFEDAMLIGYLYADYLGDYAKDNHDDWERRCQRSILDALYYKYEDALPPYLPGETDEEFPECSVVTQDELDGFFRSTVDRPNLVPDRIFEDEEVPELLPGQVPMWPTDFIVFPKVRKAVRVSDGEYLLYGTVGMGEGWCPDGVICRVQATDGYLGWRIINTEICGAVLMERTTARFVPVR